MKTGAFSPVFLDIEIPRCGYFLSQPLGGAGGDRAPQRVDKCQ